MSSFRKFGTGSQNVPKRLNGTKAWIYGQTLISSGCNSLNKVLNGGYLLGSMGVIEEDINLNQRETLVRLNLAEAVTFEQNVLVISTKTKYNMNETYTKLPTKLEQKEPERGPQNVNPQRGGMPSLQVAYQYQRYLTPNNMRMGPSNSAMSYNNTYDLGTMKTIDPQTYSSLFQLYTLEDVEMYSPQEDTEFSYIHDHYDPLLMNILHIVHSFVARCKQENKVGRIVIDQFMNYQYLSRLDNVTLLPSFLNDLHHLLSFSNCFLLLTKDLDQTQDALFPIRLTSSIRHHMDLIVTIEMWLDNQPPEEFKNTIALFRLFKLPNLLTLYTPLPAVCIYGIERSLRSIKFSELHLPPADAVSQEDKKKLQKLNQLSIGCSGQLTY